MDYDWISAELSLYVHQDLLHITSSQGGGIGRYTLPSCTTKRRTTNLKTRTNQNCQKIELYGSPTSKQLKKKHSFRLIGGLEMGSWGGEDVQQGSNWRTWASEVVAGGVGGPTFACR